MCVCVNIFYNYKYIIMYYLYITYIRERGLEMLRNPQEALGSQKEIRMESARPPAPP